MESYSRKEVVRIIQGYKSLDRRRKLSDLLKKVSKCKRCAINHPNRNDHPVNLLVRPLPLYKMSNRAEINKYCSGIKRDDTLLRKVFESSSSANAALKNSRNARFTIGLLPWLDRCMLFRKSAKTKLMVIGIDYKKFPAIYDDSNDHNFPLDGYGKQNNIWGGTWKSFWRNLLGKPYDDERVNKFIEKNGVYMTNSMLCVARGRAGKETYFEYLKCCRDYIVEQIKIVQPRVIVSYGRYGCWNVAQILLNENKRNSALQMLSDQKNFRKVKAKVSGPIKVKYNSLPITFWLMYQPAFGHIFPDNKRDYRVLKRLVGIRH